MSEYSATGCVLLLGAVMEGQSTREIILPACMDLMQDAINHDRAQGIDFLVGDVDPRPSGLKGFPARPRAGGRH